MTLPRYQSLTAILNVVDAAGCRAELAARRVGLERGWASVPGLGSACLASLPPSPADTLSMQLLVECSFVGPFADFSAALFQRVGADLSAVLAHCDGYPVAAGTRQLSDYLSARALRAAAFGGPHAAAPEALGAGRAIRAAHARLRLLLPASPAGSNALESEAQREERRVAVGMQEPEPGVPLLHVARLLPEPQARGRLKRALRDVALDWAPHGQSLRFLLHDERLLCLAYPNENAPRWSERLSQAALFPLARIWSNTRGFPSLGLKRRALRERRLQGFLLDNRVAVAAWFNAQA